MPSVENDTDSLKRLVGGSFKGSDAVARLGVLVRNPDPDLLPILTGRLPRRLGEQSLPIGRGRERFSSRI